MCDKWKIDFVLLFLVVQTTAEEVLMDCFMIEQCKDNSESSDHYISN